MCCNPPPTSLSEDIDEASCGRLATEETLDLQSLGALRIISVGPKKAVIGEELQQAGREDKVRLRSPH
jgi:hypothetical protein